MIRPSLDPWALAASLVVAAIGGAACNADRLRAAESAWTVEPEQRLEFPSTLVGARSKRSVELRNSGRVRIQLTLQTSGPFEAQPAEVRLSGGESTTVEVRFVPTVEGAAAGELVLQAEGATRRLELVGAGIVPQTCGAASACTEQSIDSTSGACVITAVADGTSCTDACLAGSACAAGQCVGTPVDCDDHDACTLDACTSSTGCVHVPLDCPPSTDPCRTVSCDPAAGCLEDLAPDGMPCGPSDCVRAHVCIQGRCEERPHPTAKACGLATLAAGDAFTCVIVSGQVQCFGRNSFQQLGGGTKQYSSAYPVSVVGIPEEVTAITAGGAHACALTRSGRVWCWGRNDSGQVGTGQFDVASASGGAHEVQGLVDVVQLAAGDAFTCARTSSGGVWCWGAYRRLGRFDGAAHQVAKPVPLPLVSAATHLTGGFGHGCAVLTSGEAHCWGYNEFGQLANGTDASSLTPVPVVFKGSVATVHGGSDLTCFVDTGGLLHCSGYNLDGRFGTGTFTTSWLPVAVKLGAPVRQLSTWGPHTCVLDQVGEVWCWGNNLLGQVGDGTHGTANMTRALPVRVVGFEAPVAEVAVGMSHSCARLIDSRVQCWGANDTGQGGFPAIHAMPTPRLVDGL